jgi:glycosyltransferase involved in cell wall biosynthesis
MRVSVVIPTYNSGRLVVEAIASALAQTHQPAEVIVVDDGSTDDTRARMAAFESPVRYVYQENQGVAAARNRGIREATGEFVAFLDADDVWHPRKLEIQLECLRRNPELGLVGTSTVDWPNEPFPSGERFANPEPALVRLKDLVVRNQFVTSSVLVRRPVLDRIGEFDRALHGPEDYDLWLRVAQATAVANLPLPLTGYRDVPASLGKQAVTMERGIGIILEKLHSAGAFRGRWLLERKAWSFYRYTCAYMYGSAGSHSTAIWLMVRSLIGYPLPYRRHEVRMPLARVRMLARACVRMIARAKPAEARRVQVASLRSAAEKALVER